jgi:predicted RNA-binding protein YlxR (DUF448 family)
VRFVVGPDKVVVPDILERLPGRGFWLKASRHIVFNACKENVFSRSARTSVTVPEDLIELVERLLRQHCLEIFGQFYWLRIREFWFLLVMVQRMGKIKSADYYLTIQSSIVFLAVNWVLLLVWEDWFMRL